ncbi:MAG: MBL fold metallo-hydrolase [Thermodesulfovibrio sp.]|nr:MBL fold metallo-hydrolase [Thermodesulfovibrio sp.]
MKIEDLVVGPLQVNCYIAYDEESLEAMIVDPGDNAAGILKILDRLRLKPRYIVCTHGHFDHIGAVAEVKASTGAEVVLHGADLQIYEGAHDLAQLMGFSLERQPAPDIIVSAGDRLMLGETVVTIMHTPGHSPGGICLLQGDLLLSGDTIFAGSIGRTDFPGGSLQSMKQSFRRIIDLPPTTQIFPGHGPGSTIAEEREMNFFIHEL